MRQIALRRIVPMRFAGWFMRPDFWLPQWWNVRRQLTKIVSSGLHLRMRPAGRVGTLVESPVSTAGLSCVDIDEKRWMQSGAVLEAGSAYNAFKHSIQGRVERYLANAAAGIRL
jgi:hypothetical protein